MGKKYRVKQDTTADGGYAGRHYGGRVGESRFDDAKECEKLTGWQVSLQFENGRADGFLWDEVEEVV